jgi:Na+-transporting NADH:ubiquinone oxidoreductase subunit C
MTALVALMLAFLFTALKPIHDKNEALYSKRAILAAVESKIDTKMSDLSDEEIQAIFDKSITQQVIDTKGNVLNEEQIAEMSYGATKAEEIDMAKQKKKPESDRILPLYIYTADNGEKYYIFSARGNGLWDAIWGNIALEDDLNTIAGVSFDHQQETPGLGAEIKENAKWKSQYIGKKFYNNAGELISIDAVKGGAKDPNHEIDAISGATITSDGVDDMLKNYMKMYAPYLNKLKQS